MATQGNASNKEQIEQQQDDWSYEEPEVLTPSQSDYLRVLEQRITLKNTYLADPGHEQWVQKAINSAAYSAFRDCLDNGLEEQAKALVSRDQQSN
jgi:hypothetical protein